MEIKFKVLILNYQLNVFKNQQITTLTCSCEQVLNSVFFQAGS